MPGLFRECSNRGGEFIPWVYSETEVKPFEVRGRQEGAGLGATKRIRGGREAFSQRSCCLHSVGALGELSVFEGECN